MQLTLILAVLLTVTAAEASPETPTGRPLLWAAAVAGCCLAVAALAEWSSRRVSLGLLRDPAVWVARRRLALRLHWGCVLGAAGAAVFLLHWPQVVKQDWHLSSLPLVDDVLLMLPLLGLLLHGWAAFHRVERAASLLISLRGGEPTGEPDWRRHVADQARHYLGLIVVPMWAVLAAHDVLHWLAPDPASASHIWVAQLALLAVLVAAMPIWLRRLWRATPLPPGPLRSLMERTAAETRLRFRDILIWNTGGQVANAAVAGFVAPVRFVFFTDRLLEMMNEQELRAVLLHEAAHVRRRHLSLRLLLLALPLAAWAAAESCWPGADARLVAGLSSCGLAPQIQVGLLLPLLAGLYAATVLGALARTLEYDADLWSARRGGAAAMISALQKLAGATVDRGATWLHPSLADRIARLRSAASDPAAAARCQAVVAWGGAALAALTAALVSCAVVAGASG